MPIHGTGRGRRNVEVPRHAEPETPDGAAAAPAGDPSAPQANAGPQDHFDRPQMPVSHNDAALNTDLSGVIVNRAAAPKHTLNASEILAAPDERKGELVRRYCSFLSLLAGGQTGTAQSEAPAAGTIARAGAKAVITDKSIELSVDGQSISIDPGRKYSRQDADALTETAILALEKLLFTGAGVDDRAAQLHLFLLGGDGLLTRGRRRPLTDGEAFANPKLLCWDFNGTVEKFGDGRPRGDLARTSRALERRGATSLITTTIMPEKPEDFMVGADIAFGGYYGKSEVRPTKGNKQYLGLAAAHGISQAEAPDRMAIFGDSKTDIPADLPGTLFFHNDAMTPAPAVELLLNALDHQGAGSLRQGLDALLGGALKEGEVRAARIGDVSFEVELRNSGDDKDPVWIPTLFNVRLDLDGPAMIDGLSSVPSSADLDARARFQLLIEHLADGLDDDVVATVVSGVNGTAGERPMLAAADRRLAHRADVVAEGREEIDKLEDVLAQPFDLDTVSNHLANLIMLGDAQVAAKLPGIVARIEAIADAAEPQLLAALDAHVADVRQAVAELAPVAVPYYANAPGGPLRARLERVIKDPVPLTAKRQKAVLKALATAQDKAVPGGKEAAKAILEQLDDAVAEAQKVVREAFASRRAAAPALLDLAQKAGPIAQKREADFAQIQAAVSAAGRQ